MTTGTIQPVFKKMVVLRDLEYQLAITGKGRIVGIREVTPDDAPLIFDLFEKLSAHTQWLRFFRPYLYQEQIWQDARKFAHPRTPDKFSLLATVCENGEERAVGLVQLFRFPDDYSTAEIAIVLRDDYQREGLGKLLSRSLIAPAQERGITKLHANAVGGNRTVISLIQSLGLTYTAQLQAGEMELIIQVPVANETQMLEDNAGNKFPWAQLSINPEKKQNEIPVL